MSYKKTYSELMAIPSFSERFEYLKQNSKIGEETFGGRRYLNQILYSRTQEWQDARTKAIIRDSLKTDYCLDLAMPGHEIHGIIIVHHINPITYDDIMSRNPCLFDLENLICVSDSTHKAIHYGGLDSLVIEPIVRTPYDTCPWRIL